MAEFFNPLLKKWSTEYAGRFAQKTPLLSNKSFYFCIGLLTPSLLNNSVPMVTVNEICMFISANMLGISPLEKFTDYSVTYGLT